MRVMVSVTDACDHPLGMDEAAPHADGRRFVLDGVPHPRRIEEHVARMQYRFHAIDALEAGEPLVVRTVDPRIAVVVSESIGLGLMSGR